MITFGFEKLADVLKEPGVKDLVESHFYEIAEDQEELPFRPDWDLYQKHEAGGMLLLYVCRDGTLLVGYHLFVIGPDPSTSTLGAWDRDYYLDPEYRSGMTGYKLLFGAEAELRKRGIRRINKHVKIKSYAGRGGIMKLFARNGYRPYEVLLSKVLP